MNRDDARQMVDSMVANYPGRKFTVANLEAYVEYVAPYDGALVAVALARLVRDSPKHLPSAPACGIAIRAEQAAVATRDARRVERLGLICQCRSQLEDPRVAAWMKTDARERLSDLVPRITRDEWREARALGDERRARWAETERGLGRVVTPALPETYRDPPPPSYAGPVPVPGDGAYILPRAEAAKRMTALLRQVWPRVRSSDGAL